MVLRWADASADPDATDGSPDAPAPTGADTGSTCGLQPFADCVWMPGVCAHAPPRCDPPAGWLCVPDLPVPDPEGPWELPGGEPGVEPQRTIRGCGWASSAQWCRLAARGSYPVRTTGASIGLRPVRTLPP